MLNIEKKRGGKFSIHINWKPVNLDIFLSDTMGLKDFKIIKRAKYLDVTFKNIEDATRFALVADIVRI
jgi:hypothetical protein